MKLSTAINKASKVYITATIANCGVSVPISKAAAKAAVREFLSMEADEGGETFNDGYDAAVAYLDLENNELYLG